MPRTSPSLVKSPAPSAAPDAAPLREWAAQAASQFVQRAALIRCALLALLAPRPVNVLVLGPPGTGKTTAAVALAVAASLRTLDVTLSPWTEAAELLGPVDLAAFKAGTLARATSPLQPTLSDAEFVILDELPRAAPGIRALTLRPLAERRLPTGQPIPAHVMLATANTRLTSEEDQAMVDRFALRVEAPPVVGTSDLTTVIGREVPIDGATPTAAPLPAIPAGLVVALRVHAASVSMPRDVLDAVVTLCETMRQPPPSGAAYPYVSERRYIIATRLLQASAALAGRSAVDWTDLVETMPYVLDDGQETRASIRTAIDACVPKWVRGLTDLDTACTAAVARAKRVGGVVDAVKGDGDAHAKLEEEFDALVAPLRAYGADVVARAETRIDAAREDAARAYAEGAAAYAAHRKATR